MIRDLEARIKDIKIFKNLKGFFDCKAFHKIILERLLNYSLLISETKNFHQLAQILNNHYFLYNINKLLPFIKAKQKIINSGSNIE
jgi:hypothetical protein